MGHMASVTEDQVREALATVNDPEIKRPITELGMVDGVEIGDTQITVKLLLTVSGCPLKDTLNRDITAAVATVAPAHSVVVDMGVMTDEQRKGMQEMLRGGRSERDIPFAQAGSLTKVYAIASGKGGVGKSTVTVNLALAMAKRPQGRHHRRRHLRTLDPRHAGRRRPPPHPGRRHDHAGPGQGHPKVISIGMLKPRKDQVVAWRGPMLDRALVQMLSDVYWGDLDASCSTCRRAPATWPSASASTCPTPRSSSSRRRSPPPPRSPSAPARWPR